MAVLGTAMPSLMPRPAQASGDLGDRLVFSTWPNYHNPANIETFTADTGVNIQINAFGSNEEMLAKLQAGATGWDVFVPTNYTISNYVELDIIRELDLSRLPNHDPSSQNPMFSDPATVNGKVYAVLKNWGTTGIVYNSDQLTTGPTSWKTFFEITMGAGSGHTIVHDYQLTTIGAALCALGYSFNSIDANELAEAEKVLIDSKPHLFAITSDYQPGMRSGDAWMSICWNGDGLQLNKDLPEMKYLLATDGGEIWSDFHCIPKEAPHVDAAYAFINFLLDPHVQVLEWSFRLQSPYGVNTSVRLRLRHCSMRPARHAKAAGALRVTVHSRCRRSPMLPRPSFTTGPSTATLFSKLVGQFREVRPTTRLSACSGSDRRPSQQRPATR